MWSICHERLVLCVLVEIILVEVNGECCVCTSVCVCVCVCEKVCVRVCLWQLSR